MTVEIVPFQDKYSNYFYDLNYDWLNEYFYVEEYDEKVLKNCKEEIIPANTRSSSSGKRLNHDTSTKKETTDALRSLCGLSRVIIIPDLLEKLRLTSMCLEVLVGEHNLIENCGIAKTASIPVKKGPVSGFVFGGKNLSL